MQKRYLNRINTVEENRQNVQNTQTTNRDSVRGRERERKLVIEKNNNTKQI